jgi:hypothetical protein
MRPATRSWPSTRSGSVDAPLLQERLALFSGPALLIIVALYVATEVLAWLGIQTRPALVGTAASLAVILILGATWLYCSGPRSLRHRRYLEPGRRARLVAGQGPGDGPRRGTDVAPSQFTPSRPFVERAR